MPKYLHMHERRGWLNRLLSLTALMGLALSFLGSAQVVRAADFTYTNDNGRITITGYTGGGGEVIIPSEIDELPVVGIGDNAFIGCAGLTSVTIPAGVTNIGVFAFNECQSLTEVTISEGVVSIGDAAFMGCWSLMRVTIPDSVARIGMYAFAGCNGLSEVTMGSGIESVGQYAFEGCGGVTRATVRGIPAVIEQHWLPMGTPGAPVYDLVIDENVTAIPDWAFSQFAVTRVTISNSVTRIGWGSFMDCLGLKDVALGGGVTNIGGSAFYNCPSLVSVAIPACVAEIGELAFGGCNGLLNVVIPDSVARIGDYAFAYCNGLTEVTMGSGIESVGQYAFDGCGGVARVTVRGIPSVIAPHWLPMGTPGAPVYDLVIDGNVTAIPDWAFSQFAVTRVTISNSVTRIGWGSFMDCLGLKDVALGGGLTNIGGSAFCNCPSLASVAIPDSVTGIGEWAFGGCNGLPNVVIPDSVAHIGVYAFAGCNGLSEVTMGSGIESVGQSAFEGCGGVTRVTVRGFPSSVVDYYGVPGWPSLSRVFDSLSYCAVIDTCVGKIGDHAFEDCMGLTAVEMRPGVTNIGRYAFSGCQNLPEAVLREGLIAIDDFAFQGCSGLTCVVIPASVTAIGSGVFAWCYNLAVIGVAEASAYFMSLEGVLMDKGRTAVIQWPGDKTGVFSVPQSVRRIDDYAFAGCIGPTELYFRGDAPSVGEGAFSGADGFRIYYSATASGWGPSLGGYPTLLWNPQVQAGSVGLTESGFGFVISNAGSPAVVIEACTNLSGAVWIPVATNVLSGGTATFGDADWAQHVSRFYRFGMP